MTAHEMTTATERLIAAAWDFAEFMDESTANLGPEDCPAARVRLARNAPNCVGSETRLTAP